jgi:hypothetical protein
MTELELKDLYKKKKKQLEELNKEIESLDKINSNEMIIKELNFKKYNLEKVIKFVREGAFCTYKVLEMLKPNLIKEEKIINGKLNPNYSLIRLSAGLINDELDIWKTIEKLCYINSKF